MNSDYKQLIKQILAMIRSEPDAEKRYYLKRAHDELIKIFDKNIVKI